MQAVKSKERIPVMMRGNATGSERCRLLVIGKAVKPHCFKGIKTLPVDYTSNKKSWMMREIFTDGLHALDRKFVAQHRNVLMFIDNCPAHCDVSGLKAIRLAFLPKNMTAVLQLMDRGVIQILKTLYRRHLLGRIVSLDSCKSYDVNLLGAIHMPATSWNSIKQETVANRFCKCGFGKAPEACNLEALCEGDSAMLDPSYATLSEGADFKSYVYVDSDVKTSGPLSDADIKEAACCQQTLQGSRAPNTADSGNESNEGNESVPPPSACKAASALDVAARYFIADENSDAALELLGKLQAMLTESRQKELKQMHITDFLLILISSTLPCKQTSFRSINSVIYFDIKACCSHECTSVLVSGI